MAISAWPWAHTITFGADAGELLGGGGSQILLDLELGGVRWRAQLVSEGVVKLGDTRWPILRRREYHAERRGYRAALRVQAADLAIRSATAIRGFTAVPLQPGPVRAGTA